MTTFLFRLDEARRLLRLAAPRIDGKRKVFKSVKGKNKTFQRGYWIKDWVEEKKPSSQMSPPPRKTPPPSRLKVETDGWKLHLSTGGNKDLFERISQQLVSVGVRHKPEHNSGQEGKDATIYVGSKDDAFHVANEIERIFGDELLTPTGKDVLHDDIPFTEKVMGRFDIWTSEDDFHQYGERGVPLLKDDWLNKMYGGDADRAYERAKEILTERYGEFFTGSHWYKDPYWKETASHK